MILLPQDSNNNNTYISIRSLNKTVMIIRVLISFSFCLVESEESRGEARD